MRGLAKDPKSFWHDRIILGDEIDRKKPISISAFSKAIRPTVSLCLNSLQQDGRISTAVLEKEEALIAGYIDRAWHAVCRKWPKCFSQDGVTYNESYNICKGIGVVPIYALFHECVSDCEANLEMDFPNLSIRSAPVMYPRPTGWSADLLQVCLPVRRPKRLCSI